jgi:hypothetical protein
VRREAARYHPLRGLQQVSRHRFLYFDGIELTREKTYHLAYAVAQIADTNWPDVMRMAFVNRVNCWKTQRWVISSQAPDGVYNFQS